MVSNEIIPAGVKFMIRPSNEVKTILRLMENAIFSKLCKLPVGYRYSSNKYPGRKSRNNVPRVILKGVKSNTNERTVTVTMTIIV